MWAGKVAKKGNNVMMDNYSRLLEPETMYLVVVVLLFMVLQWIRLLAIGLW